MSVTPENARITVQPVPSTAPEMKPQIGTSPFRSSIQRGISNGQVTMFVNPRLMLKRLRFELRIGHSFADFPSFFDAVTEHSVTF